jgi:hypothetical protein
MSKYVANCCPTSMKVCIWTWKLWYMDFFKLKKPNYKARFYNNVETTIQTSGDQLGWCLGIATLHGKRLNSNGEELGGFYMAMTNNVVSTYQPKEVK